MLRLAALLALLGATLHAADEPRPEIRIAELASPAGAGASGGSLVTAPDGTLWFSWLEPVAAPAGTTALRYAQLAPTATVWSAPQTIARGTNWFLNWADFPALTVGASGAATAVWFVNNPAPASAPTPASAGHDHDGPGYHAQISRTTDGGKTWSAPAPLTRESAAVEFVALATLADGRVLAAWLDGRAKKTGGKAQQLFARIVGDSGPDRLVDASVCDCCQTTLTAFPDGTALLAYRGRTEEEVRDIRITRFRGSAWDDPRPLNNDDWRINGCPVNGPRLASDGGRVGAAWFTAAGNKPQVLATFSPDVGARFLMPLKIDLGQPTGRVDTTLLHDGAMLVTWLEADGSTWLRRITPDFSANDPVRLATGRAGRAQGFPRIALRRDYAGGKTEAELVTVVAADGAAGGLRTLQVAIPEGGLLEADKSCDCAPTAEQLSGFPVRGTIVQALPDTSAVRIRHFEVPGIFADGTREFKVAPAILSALPAGRQFLGRIERRDGVWWLFDVRLLAGAVRSP